MIYAEKWNRARKRQVTGFRITVEKYVQLSSTKYCRGYEKAQNLA